MPFRSDGIYFDEVLTDPTTPEEGQLWYNASDNQYKVHYQGTTYVMVDTGNQDLIDHTQIQNIGVNSHETIDTHLASTANPHVVTATQVGLGNVTNDAQLKRSAGDFATFLDKTAPVDADILLIEDSADGGNKKRIQVGDLPGGQGGDPTSAIAEATGDTSTTSTADVAVPDMTLTPAAGNYLVWFSSSVEVTDNGEQVFTSIYAGGTKQLASERQIGFFRSNDARMNFSCMAYVTVNGVQAIEGRWRTSVGTATMHQRTLVLLKVL